MAISHCRLALKWGQEKKKGAKRPPSRGGREKSGAQRSLASRCLLSQGGGRRESSRQTFRLPSRPRFQSKLC